MHENCPAFTFICRARTRYKALKYFPNEMFIIRVFVYIDFGLVKIAEGTGTRMNKTKKYGEERNRMDSN